jgi:hypothetical protein
MNYEQAKEYAKKDSVAGPAVWRELDNKYGSI